jgi:threonine dehydrogenase-like Zn-dependent dehydrogenase
MERIHALKSKFLIVNAEKRPVDGIANPGPHQIYRDPRVSVLNRELGGLGCDKVRVEMIYGGLCGTDVHLVETNPDTGYIRCSAPADIPKEGRIIGHEGVGKVVEVGSRVYHVKEGDYVTFESIIVCYHCNACRRGQFNQCQHARLLGLEQDGLFGTIVDVPSMLTHEVNALAGSDKGLKTSACIEPAGVAYVACQNTHVSAGDVIVVFGAGPIGLFSAMLGKVVFGASRVHVVEPVKFRRMLAKKWSDHIYDIDEFFDDGPCSVDVVIEASGNMDNVNRVFRRLNANGRVAILGRSGVPLVLDAVDHMITNAVSLVGSRGHLGGAFAKIISLCENNRISLDGVVTEIVNGTEGLCDLLQSPKKILEENCKVLVRLNG